MEKSLNSSRNFKLPPIQGAVPAANILRQPPPTRHTQSWRPPHDQRLSSAATLPNHHRSPVKPRAVIHVPQDPFPGRYRSPQRNLSTAASASRRDYASILNEKNTESKLEFAPLRHQFPQSYTVLPPIQKIKEPPRSETQTKSAQDRAHRSEKGHDNLTDGNKSAVDNSLRNDKQKREDVRKVADNNNNHKNPKTDTSRSVAEEKGSTKKKNRSESQDKETGERKPSATTLLFLKGKRKGRRVGVCLENEPALINVTEQLKEIFLRRNMEEMYLI